MRGTAILVEEKMEPNYPKSEATNLSSGDPLTQLGFGLAQKPRGVLPILELGAQEAPASAAHRHLPNSSRAVAVWCELGPSIQYGLCIHITYIYIDILEMYSGVGVGMSVLSEVMLCNGMLCYVV